MYDLTLVPAYGRDYKTPEEAKAAWRAGKDFIIQSVMSPYLGKYASIHEVLHFPGQEIRIRYAQRSEILILKVEEEKAYALANSLVSPSMGD